MNCGKYGPDMTSYGLNELLLLSVHQQFASYYFNRLQLYLISPLVHFKYELGQVMVRYDFLWAIQVILINVWTDSQLDLIALKINFLYELGKIMTKYDFIEARWMILRNVQTDFNIT